MRKTGIFRKKEQVTINNWLTESRFGEELLSNIYAFKRIHMKNFTSAKGRWVVGKNQYEL